MIVRTIPIAALLVASLAGCGADDDDTVGDVTETPGTSGATDPTTGSPTSGPVTTPSTTEAPWTTDAPTTTGAPPTSSPTGSSVPSSRAAEQAIADLAGRRGADPSAIATVSVDEVTWRDASLGCPRKGMQYAQVLTDGIRIVLEAGGKRYEYHAGPGRAPFYCPRPEPPVGES